METTDALIIGGGPAGSTCARALTRAGLDVLLLDKATFPRDKPCAGWITPSVVRLLRLDLDAYRASGRVCQPISAFRTSRLGRRAVDTDFGEPVSYGICRREFDHYLLERCGARVRMGTPLASLRRDGESWIVNEAIRTPLLIGAGGHFCPVARHLAADVLAAGAATDTDAERADAGEPIVAAQEIEVRMTPAQAAACDISGDRPELFLCEDFKGYGWCFRKEDVLNIGLGRLDRHRLSAHVRAFADGLAAAGRVPKDLAWRWKGHAYLLRETSARRLVDDGVLLIGDAAGLAYGRSGEGIRPAVESALLAARTILDAHARSRGVTDASRPLAREQAESHAFATAGGTPEYAREALEPYRAAIETRFGAGAEPLAYHEGDAREGRAWSSIPERLSLSLATALMASRRFTREVLLRRWFLRMQEPPLAIAVELDPLAR